MANDFAGLEVEPVEWSVVYPVNPDDPIGRICRDGDGFRAWLRDEDLGWYPSGDAASEAVWERYLHQIRAEHDSASRTHGSHERDGVCRSGTGPQLKSASDLGSKRTHSR